MNVSSSAVLVWLALVVAGCASSAGAPSRPRVTPVDPATALVGGWTGEWRSRDRSGGATLDIFQVADGIVSGRLSLDRYASDVESGGQPFRGVVSAEDGELRLSLPSSSPALELRARGVTMRGASAVAGIPSQMITLTLQKIR